MPVRSELFSGSRRGREGFSKNALSQADAIRFNRETFPGRRRVEGALAIDPEGTPDPEDAITVDYHNG